MTSTTAASSALPVKWLDVATAQSYDFELYSWISCGGDRDAMPITYTRAKDLRHSRANALGFCLHIACQSIYAAAVLSSIDTHPDLRNSVF